MAPMTLLRRAIVPALLALLASAVPASAGLILPEAGPSPNAQDTKTLYTIILVLGVIVFVGVEGVLFYCLFKYRAKKGRVAAQIHGNTRLEIGWTVGAAVILVFLTVATFVMLPGIKNPAASSIDENGNPVASNAAFAATDQEAPPEGASMNIKVDGMQYAWQFTYPSIDDKTVFAYTDMYVPVGMTITLDIGSNDVQHSWWIPELGGKMDALPGLHEQDLVQGRRSRAASAASAPSCAGATTPTCTRASWRCPSTSGRRGTTARPTTSRPPRTRPPQGRKELRAAGGLRRDVQRGRRHRHHLRGFPRVGLNRTWPHSTTRPARRPARRSSPTACGPSPRAGRRGSRRPTTSGSGSSTSGRSPRSSCSAASRRC